MKPRLKVVARNALLVNPDGVPHGCLRPGSLADRLAMRAYHPVYRPGEVNRCPGCGRSHWWVGRSSAECAFCEAIVPIAEGGV